MPLLTAAQFTALKADITADSTLNALPNSADGNDAIATAYNKLAVPDFFVWSTAVDVSRIYDAINWANYTPNDDPSQAAALAAQVWENRAMACQIKQVNLQLILQGRATINGSRSNVRAGLTDALTNIPSGNNGAARGNAASVLATLARKATRLEKLFADTSGGTGATTATPATLGTDAGGNAFEGTIDLHVIEQARNS